MSLEAESRVKFEKDGNRVNFLNTPEDLTRAKNEGYRELYLDEIPEENRFAFANKKRRGSAGKKASSSKAEKGKESKPEG